MKPMMMRLMAAALMVALAACSPKPEAGEPVKHYEMHGTVLRLDAKAKIATIRHDQIDDWMEAMTMDFPVPDAAEFAKLAPDTEIRARVTQKPSTYEFWLDQIQVLPKQSPK